MVQAEEHSLPFFTCLVGSGRAAARQVVLAARPDRLAGSYPAGPMFDHSALRSVANRFGVIVEKVQRNVL